MPFIRTQLATDFEKPKGWLQRLFDIDTANPSYRGKYHLVKHWLIEFDEDGIPAREIGLDDNDHVVLAGPSERDYGFWLDTNMRLADFGGEPISEEYFESMWVASGVVPP